MGVDLSQAVTDPGWLIHWRELWQEKLDRKRQHDDESLHLKICIALVDSALERFSVSESP